MQSRYRLIPTILGDSAILVAALAFNLIVATAIHAGPRIVGPEDPAGKEVRETAAAFYHDISDGNAAAAHALFAGPADHGAVLDAELEAVAASREMMRSILSHFGPDNANLLSSSAIITFLRFGDRALTGMVVLNGSEAATAGGSEPDHGLLLRKVDGKWKVIHATRESHRTATARKYYTLVSAAYDDVRRKVDRGELKTADAALTAMQKKLDALNGQRSTDPEDTGRALVPSTQLAPTAERLRSLMGRQISSPQVGDFIDSLTVTPGLGEYSTVVFVNVPELGFDLSFKQPEGRLQAVHLYGGGADVRFGRYTGALPAGLAFGQPRIDVERRLGRPASFSGWIESGVAAEYPNLKLLVQYAPGPNAFRIARKSARQRAL